MGRVAPGSVTQETAARLSSVGGVRVTRATSTKVRLPPTGRLAVHDTCPPAATPRSLAETNSKPVDRVWVTLALRTAAAPLLRTFPAYLSSSPARAATCPSLMLMVSPGARDGRAAEAVCGG